MAGGVGEEGLDGVPAWRLALKRPRHELTPKERALEKVSRYLDKFGDMFLRPAQRKVLAVAREKVWAGCALDVFRTAVPFWGHNINR